MYAVVGDMMKHSDGNEPFWWNAIFRGQDSDLIEVEYQFDTIARSILPDALYNHV
jgi:hypothetical protein